MKTCTIDGRRYEVVQEHYPVRHPPPNGEPFVWYEAVLLRDPPSGDYRVISPNMIHIQETVEYDWAKAAENTVPVEVSDGEGNENGSHHAFLDAYQPRRNYPFEAYKMSDCGGPWNFKHCRLIAQDPDKWLIEED